MTTLMVQIDKVLYNFRALVKAAGKSQVIPVLEGNAYGLGDVPIARLLHQSGVGLVAVSRLEEAERLISAVTNVDVLLMSCLNADTARRVVQQDRIIASVGSNEEAVLLSSAAREFNTRARVHVHFDCGMARGGFPVSEAGKVVRTIKGLGNLLVCGIYSQPPGPFKSEKKERARFRSFQEAVRLFKREGIDPEVIHYAGPMGFLTFPWMRTQAVRLDDALLGGSPYREKWGLRQVGRVVAEVSQVYWVPEGRKIGPQAAFHTRRATRVAVVPVGFADGLFTEWRQNNAFSFWRKHRLTCEISGQTAPVIGHVGYTSMAVDVTDITCSSGDLVYIDASPDHINATMRRDYV